MYGSGLTWMCYVWFRFDTGVFCMVWVGHGCVMYGSGLTWLCFVWFRFDMGTGPAVLKSRSRVNDGSQHRVVVDRLGRAGSISVDRDETVHGTSQGPLQMLNVNGDIYFGRC